MGWYHRWWRDWICATSNCSMWQSQDQWNVRDYATRTDSLNPWLASVNRKKKKMLIDGLDKYHRAPDPRNGDILGHWYGDHKRRKVSLPSYFLVEFPPLLHSLLYLLHYSFYKIGCAKQVTEFLFPKKVLYNWDDWCNWKEKFIREQSLESRPVTAWK